MRGGSSRRLSELPIRTNFATFRVNHEPRTRRAGTPPDRLRSRLGSRERTGVRESIYESGLEESRKSRQRDLSSLTASDTDALQFFEGVAQMIEDIARQKRLLALIAVENCDLRCATA